MGKGKSYIAVDLGAESGRVMLGTVSGERIGVREVHRFSNGPVERDGTMRWDFDGLMSEVGTGIHKAASETQDIAGIGIDSWGVDFGLLDGEGDLLEEPYHYRDSRTDGMMERAFEMMPRRDIYEHSGIQFMQLNTVYQLLAMRFAGSPVLAKAKKLVFIADLLANRLCGETFGEFSLASTSQLMNMKTGTWSEEIFNALGLPIDLMPDVVAPGTVVGKLSEKVAAKFGCGRIPVIASASHDTAAAVAAVPVREGNWAYLSSGTWSLVGIETPEAVVTGKSFEYGFTNEGGVAGTIRLLRNIMGLWVLQECRRQWRLEGHEMSYAELMQIARNAEPFALRVDPDHAAFFSPGDMPAKVNTYLAETGQEPTENKGRIVRAILEGLAFKYRWVMDMIEDTTGSTIDILHIVGGGTQNVLLNKFAASATSKKVHAGPVEATAIGNVIMQAIGTGQIGSLADARTMVRNSFEVKQFLPANIEKWRDEFEKAKEGYQAD
ncbi:rhamnulokinase family protein [Planctomycetota bacterium]